jgi:hypothetical protein
MKAPFTLALLFFSFVCLKAQITIGQNDFANANDTDRVSMAVIPNGLNYQATGADTTWDYSFLQWNTQQVDKLLNPFNTNTLYALYFANVGFNSNRSNIASQGTLNFSLASILTLNNVYNFFYKNSSSYVQQGMGISIDGIPTNISFTDKDVLYKFPVNYGDTTFTSNSKFSIALPQVGGVAHIQTRTNQVDGWGNLTTPFGTFPVLRMVTQIVSSDSVYIDTLHYGLKIPLPEVREYKWIGNGQKEPLLQVNTSVVLGFETITSIVYRDSVRNRPVPPPVDTFGVGIAPLSNADLVFNVYPNPASNNFQVNYPAGQGEAQLVISDLDGRELLHKTFAGQIETIDASQWEKGIYLVMLTNNKQTSVRKIIIQ